MLETYKGSQKVLQNFTLGCRNKKVLWFYGVGQTSRLRDN